MGLLFERTPEALAALLAVLKAGGAYVPLDPGSPPEHRAAIGADAGLAALVGQAGLAPGIPNRPILDVDRADRNLDLESAEPLEGPSLPETAAYVIYTSGSTGAPRASSSPIGASLQLASVTGNPVLHDLAGSLRPRTANVQDLGYG